MSYRGFSLLRVPQGKILRLESAINGYSDGTVTFNIIDQKKRYYLKKYTLFKDNFRSKMFRRSKYWFQIIFKIIAQRERNN